MWPVQETAWKLVGVAQSEQKGDWWKMRPEVA